MSNAAKTSLRHRSLDKAKLSKRCSYVGIFFLFLTVCIPLYWGNLSVYSESYLRNRLGLACNTAWMIPCCNIGCGVGAVVTGYIESFVGWKWTIILSCILIDLGVTLSSVSIRYSVMRLNLSMGLLAGMGTGIMLTMSIRHVLSFRPRYAGVVTGVITSARYLGGACWNQMITWYVNPANLIPDTSDGRQSYFTQSKVLDNVPSVFLWLGVSNISCHMIGIALIKQNVDEEHEDSGGNPVLTKIIDGNAYGEKNAKVLTEPPKETNTPLMLNISPADMLKTRAFYVISFALSLAQYGEIILLTYYKAYGQIWIADDQFIAFFATTFLLASMLMRPVVGVCMDRCGVKHSVMFINCVCCVIANFLYFTPMVSNWLYFVWTILYSCINASVFLIFPVAVSEVFGNEHFSKNYGILVFSCTVINLLLPTLIHMLFSSCGWFYLFFSVGCVNAIGLILNALYLPGPKKYS